MRIVGYRTNLSAPVRDPRRIVAIAPSNTEILHALGLGRRIVGVDRWSDYPPRVRNLPSVGSDLHVDVDQVSALQPDVVVASLHVPGMEDNLPSFEAARLPYLAVGGTGLDGVWQDMRTIGHYLGRAERAAALIASTQARMSQIQSRYGSRRPRPTVHWEWSARPVVAARRSWITELLHMAGGENIYLDLDVESVRITPEQAIARQPEVVVACWCGARKLPTVQRILDRPGWQSTPAVREQRVAVFAEDLFGRPGPRLADGLERLARLLHPDV
ncbi:MAG TPA: cobalamin-binding protein [Chloroflexota bacterium]|jgi:iron complex transport system substrate-binding protein